MNLKFFENVVPLSELTINSGKVIRLTQDTHRPILLTSRGIGVAVWQGIEDYEKTEAELRFVKAVIQGLVDFREGNTLSLEEAKKTLAIE